MRRQTLIALGIAVLLGLLAVFLANTFLTRTERQAAVVPEGMTKIAVAAVPLDYGVELTPDKVRFASYPASSVPPGSFRQISELLPAGKRRVALRQMLINEPILANKISGEGQGASISALLPDGMRATALRINDVSGVAGFIQPNDSVDVLISRPGPSGQQVTDVLLQDVRVIAIGQNAQGQDGKPALAKSATLEVDPINAQKIVLAQQVGALSLVLRKPGQEQDIPRVETVSMQDLRYSLYARGSRYPVAAASGRPVQVTRVTPRVVRRPAPAVRAAPPPRTNSVQVIRGTEGNNYEVGDYGS